MSDLMGDIDSSVVPPAEKINNNYYERDVENFTSRGHYFPGSYLTQQLLDKFCTEGLIPKGTYVIQFR